MRRPAPAPRGALRRLHLLLPPLLLQALSLLLLPCAMAAAASLDLSSLSGTLGLHAVEIQDPGDDSLPKAGAEGDKTTGAGGHLPQAVGGDHGGAPHRDLGGVRDMSEKRAERAPVDFLSDIHGGVSRRAMQASVPSRVSVRGGRRPSAKELSRVVMRRHLPEGQEEELTKQGLLELLGDGRLYVVGHPDGFVPLDGTPGTARGRGGGRGGASFVGASGRPVFVATAPGTVSITVETKNETLNWRISDLVFGMNEYGTDEANKYEDVETVVRGAAFKLVRTGGNRDSRFNWKYDTRNTGADWFFENIAMQPAPSSNWTAVDAMFQAAKNRRAETLLTIPVLGWLPKSNEKLCSFNISKYGTQKKVDPGYTDCGNGDLDNGTYISWNDRTDAAALYGPDHQKAFVASLVKKWGKASEGGVKFYCIDNEPVYWAVNHYDIFRGLTTYDHMLQKNIEYAAAIKAADPTATVHGAVLGGWYDTFYSYTDIVNGYAKGPWFSNPVDRQLHGGVPHLEWFLERMRAYEEAYGHRLIDVVDVHAYVAGRWGTDGTDPSVQYNRIQTVRILWDPTFDCHMLWCDWIDPPTAPNGVPMYLVRLQDIINRKYPGLGLALTEYNFGGNLDISGAVAQAEALGVFIKLRLSAATIFPAPKVDSTVYKAFKMYGNYDGEYGRFGSLGVSAVSSNVTVVSVYAAIDEVRNVLTVMIINLTPLDQNVDLTLKDVSPTAPIKYFRYDASDLRVIQRLADFPANSTISYTFPNYSLNMLEVALP